ncbi:unnamed protein product [Caenorhabditis bovis]|uniref:Transmembrane protein 65 n=1 Tax=Caenorhabditis bovis TaxID=2654633 RepID=A0A8S1EPR0_9PELO|nr:unnamed protein product [Caenorhabditis bovis]
MNKKLWQISLIALNSWNRTQILRFASTKYIAGISKPPNQCGPLDFTAESEKNLKKMAEIEKEKEKQLQEMKKKRAFFGPNTPLPFGIVNNDDAKLFCKELLPGERKILFDALRKITADQYNEHQKVQKVVIDYEDLKKVWYLSFTPAFVYGLLDEAFLIIGGDQINQIFSVYNGMSMLASAAVANIICNLVLQYPSTQSSTILGIKRPTLSADQMNTPDFFRVQFGANMIGLWLGLTLGMIPLFFIDDNSDNRGYRIDWHHMADAPFCRDLFSHEYCDLKEHKQEYSGASAKLVIDTHAVMPDE